MAIKLIKSWDPDEKCVTAVFPNGAAHVYKNGVTFLDERTYVSKEDLLAIIEAMETLD